MNISSAPLLNYQSSNYLKNNKGSNINFGDLRKIKTDDLADLFQSSLSSEKIKTLEAFNKASWKDELGEVFDYQAVFKAKYQHKYDYLILKPFHDKKSKLPPLPCEVKLYPFEIENKTYDDIMLDIEKALEKEKEKRSLPQREAAIKEKFLEVNGNKWYNRIVQWFND